MEGVVDVQEIVLNADFVHRPYTPECTPGKAGSELGVVEGGRVGLDILRARGTRSLELELLIEFV
jgi:hypothetical protein